MERIKTKPSSLSPTPIQPEGRGGRQGTPTNLSDVISELRGN